MPEQPVSTIQNLKPSTSTVTGVFAGGTFSAIVLWAAGEYFNFNPPPEIAAQIGILISALVGYPFSGGRSETSL
jgi:hypothetical protein